MVHHFLLFFIFFNLSAFGQDERYYRHILNGELPKMSKEFKEEGFSQFNLGGALYRLDINGDGIEETIQPQKRDGVDWIELKDSAQRKIFEGKLIASGGNSVLYKIRLAHLSSTLKALILFFDEGSNRGKKFESTARFYVLSMDNNDFTTLKMTQGPHMYHEKEAQREQYWTRDYAVEIRDLNGDGVKEIMINYNHIQRIMTYQGKGEWSRF